MSNDEHKRRGLLRRALKRVLGGGQEPAPSGAPCAISFEQKGVVVGEGVVPAGTPLLLAAARMGVRLEHFCGGQCSCGTCWVDVLEGAQNLSPREGMEQMVLGHSRVKAGNRLACQAKAHGPVKVRIPEWF